MPKAAGPTTRLLPACLQVWQVAIALYLVGTVIWNTMATGERIID